jgi:hypothetical protein
MGFIKNWFVKRAFKKLQQHTPHEKTLDDELVETSKQYLETLRTIEKQHKVLEAKRRIKDLNNAQAKAQKKLTENEEEEDEDYEEEDEDYEEEDEFTQFITDMAKKAVMNKINPASSVTPSLPVETIAGAVTQTPLKSVAKSTVNGLIDKMSDEQIETLIKQYVSRK